MPKRQTSSVNGLPGAIGANQFAEVFRGAAADGHLEQKVHSLLIHNRIQDRDGRFRAGKDHGFDGHSHSDLIQGRLQPPRRRRPLVLGYYPRRAKEAHGESIEIDCDAQSPLPALAGTGSDLSISGVA